MKKSACLALAVLFVLLLFPAGALEETVTFSTAKGSVSAPADAEYIDLDLLAVPNTDEGWQSFFSFLSRFPRLKKVDMYFTVVYRKRIEEMAARFPGVEFGWTMAIPCTNPLHPDRTPHLIRTDCTAFSTLHNNQCSEHTARDFSILKYCKNLKALDIGHNQVDDLSFLYDLPRLKVLIVACNLSLQDITPIGSLKELEYLEIFKNNVQDISCLARCENLVDLNICFNRIRDLTPLHGLKRLRRLWLFNSNNYSDDIPVPFGAVQALRQALPDCRVDSTSYSTEGGWREHPRYDTLSEMFWSGKYMPFTTLD